MAPRGGLTQAGQGRRDPPSPCGYISLFGRRISKRVSKDKTIGCRKNISEVYAIFHPSNFLRHILDA
jgi:hypothetical protein